MDLEPSHPVYFRQAVPSERLIEFLRRWETVAFLDWQNIVFLHKFLSDPKNVGYECRDYEGNIIGAVLGGVMGTRGVINHLAVDEHARGLGVSHRLIKRAFDRFKFLGVYRVFLFVEEENHRAVAFYKKVGFEPITTELTLEIDLLKQTNR